MPRCRSAAVASGATASSAPGLSTHSRRRASSPRILRRPVTGPALRSLAGAAARLERSRRPSGHPKMASQGTAHTLPTRASIAGTFRPLRWPRGRWAASSLADALLLCELLANADPSRYERAALRWLQRFIDERSPPLTEVTLAESAPAESSARPPETAVSRPLKRLLRHRLALKRLPTTQLFQKKQSRRAAPATALVIMSNYGSAEYSAEVGGCAALLRERKRAVRRDQARVESGRPSTRASQRNGATARARVRRSSASRRSRS